MGDREHSAGQDESRWALTVYLGQEAGGLSGDGSGVPGALIKRGREEDYLQRRRARRVSVVRQAEDCAAVSVWLWDVVHDVLVFRTEGRSRWGRWTGCEL